MEQYTIYHNKSVQPRNQLEKHIILYVKHLLTNPVEHSIEQVRDAVVKAVCNYKKIHTQCGTIKVGEVAKFSRYKNHPHICTRAFYIFGRGRGTHTLCIAETIDKNENDSCRPAVKPWEK